MDIPVVNSFLDTQREGFTAWLAEAAFDEALRAAINGVFRNEDEWMISLIQKNMGAQTDLLSMKPVILPTDACAVRARRIMKKRIEEEEVARSAA